MATTEAVIEPTATPGYAEIDSSLNMEMGPTVELFTSRTKAVLVVHISGVPARMNEIANAFGRADIEHVENVTWSCTARYKLAEPREGLPNGWVPR